MSVFEEVKSLPPGCLVLTLKENQHITQPVFERAQWILLLQMGFCGGIILKEGMKLEALSDDQLHQIGLRRYPKHQYKGSFQPKDDREFARMVADCAHRNPNMTLKELVATHLEEGQLMVGMDLDAYNREEIDRVSLLPVGANATEDS